MNAQNGVEYALHLLNLAEDDLAGRSHIRGRRREAVAVAVTVAKRHLEKALEVQKNDDPLTGRKHGDVAFRKVLTLMLDLLPGYGVAAANELPIPVPIITAPIKPGEEFGPCLLWAPDAANYPQVTCWLIGGWDGESWDELEGTADLHPTHWHPLPAPGPLTEAQRDKIREMLAEGEKWRRKFEEIDAIATEVRP